MTLVELCAGTAALSLRLHARNARPPVSRMGSKTGYADAILGLAGLTSGQRADRYVWADADPLMRQLLGAYADPSAMNETVAAMRRLAAYDPRELWVTLQGTSAFAERLWLLGHGDPSKPPRLSRIYAAPEGDSLGRWKAPPRDWLVRRLDGWSCLPAAILPSAHDVGPLPPGSVVYIDPPYVGTTGYGHDLPRAEVVALALRHAEHLVMVSEAEPVAELVALGWHAVDITSARVGQKRTFSKQQREWVTMNRPPVVCPVVQEVLF